MRGRRSTPSSQSQTVFSRLAKSAARAAGHPAAFAAAGGIVLCWALLGPAFHFSDTWQLVINTSTTVVTFLMVFLIQSTQNRDIDAIQVKLDELIRVTRGAHNALLDLEDLSDEELDRVKRQYERLAAATRGGSRKKAS
jgi:low affinity Fe/Cu permease